MATNSSRLKKRSLISAYFEAARLYLTNFQRYFPAIVLPAFLLFLLEQGNVKEYWLEKPSVGAFLLLFIDTVAVVLLSGILGHITAHIYVGHKTGIWETLRSALRLVPAEFVAGLIAALPAVLLVVAVLKDSRGTSNVIGCVIWFVVFWGVSIVSSVVVEAEGIKNPFRAIGRAFQLVFKDKPFINSFRIVSVVFTNFIVIAVLPSQPVIKLLLKMLVEPVFEIVYGLLYFNLRFEEGPFDVKVLAKQLASESQRPAEAPAAG